MTKQRHFLAQNRQASELRIHFAQITLIFLCSLKSIQKVNVILFQPMVMENSYWLYNSNNNICYGLSHTELTYEDSVKVCADAVGQLAIVDNSQVNSHISRLFRIGGSHNWWISGKCKFKLWWNYSNTFGCKFLCTLQKVK